jgi:hypothetical protein
MLRKPVLILLSAALLLLALTSPAAAAQEPRVTKYASMIRAEPGLVAYWPFDGDLTDTQGRAPGKGGPPGVRFVAGPADGNAVLLEKGGFVTMGPCPHLDLPQTTIELIFQLRAPPTGKYDPTLIAKRTGHLETRFSFHVIKDMKRLALWNGSQVVYFDPPGGPLAIGRWHHLAATWKPGDLRLYLDGIRCEGDTADFNLRYTELPLQVGSSSPAGAHQCDCAVAQVAIYDRVLPAGAIARHVDALSWGRDARASGRGAGPAPGGPADVGTRPDPCLSRRVFERHQLAGRRDRRRTDPDQRPSAAAYLADLPELRGPRAAQQLLRGAGAG